ncbi:MAG TPA: hypothetical protein VF801_11555, partial [Rhodocyclaceae bacterium]
DALDELALNRWPFLLESSSVKPIAEVEYGANYRTVALPDFTCLWFRFGTACFTRSLFRNGVLYARLLFPGGLPGLLLAWLLLYGLTGWLVPVGLFVHLRWCGTGCRRQFLQAGIGWKLNGRFAVLLRMQSDDSAAAGVNGPNLGQARGWGMGDH